MNNVMKVILSVLAILYLVSPIDLCPGPIDDIIVLLLTLAYNKGSDLLNDLINK